MASHSRRVPTPSCVRRRPFISLEVFGRRPVIDVFRRYTKFTSIGRMPPYSSLSLVQYFSYKIRKSILYLCNRLSVSAFEESEIPDHQQYEKWYACYVEASNHRCHWPVFNPFYEITLGLLSMDKEVK